jgi:arylsulfatase A-like enzyme/Flp pilus assembly protein TadD
MGRWFSGTLVCALLATSCMGQPGAHSRASRKPDVFLITVDTLRPDHIGCYGDKQIRTPSLDQLARDGILFTNAFSAAPITNSSHASILTGVYPSFHGVTDFGVPLNPATPTIAQAMKQQGYATAAFIGAFILDSSALAPGFDRGFDFYDNFPRHLPKTASRYVRVERRGMEVVEHAEKWLRAHPPGKQPRFVWVHLYDPHDPYDPPEPFRTNYHDRLYDGEIAYADSALGNLLRFLKRGHSYGGAMFVVVGDHGEGLGEHGEETHGIFLYDSTMHVPLIIKLPFSPQSSERRGMVLTQQVRSVDIVPTILDEIRAALPQHLDGKPLQLLWSKSDEAERVAIGETDYPLRFGWAPLKSIREDEKKYIEAPRPELYDLRADPHELNNIYAPWDASLQKLRQQMADFRARAHDLQPPTAGVPAQSIEELKALGYLGSNPGATTAAAPMLLPDPKDKIEIQNLLHTAMLADDDRNYTRERNALEKAIKSDSKSAAALTQLGELELDQGNNARAADLLAQALALRPDDSAAALAEGQARFNLGNLSGARDAVEASLKLSSGQYDARLLLGKIYARLKDWAKAEDQLEAATFIDSSKPEPQIELGRVLLSESKPQDALEHLQAAKKLDPSSAEIFDLIAQADTQLGRRADAATAANIAQSLRQNTPK